MYTFFAGLIPDYGTDPFVVATHPDGGQGAFGYWVFPLGDGIGQKNRKGYCSDWAMMQCTGLVQPSPTELRLSSTSCQ